MLFIDALRASSLWNCASLASPSYVCRMVVCSIFRTSKSCQLGWNAKSGACPGCTCSSTCSFCQLRSFLLLYCGWPICIYTATVSTTRPSCSQQRHPTLFLHPHWSCPVPWRRKSAAQCTLNYCRCVESILLLSRSAMLQHLRPSTSVHLITFRLRLLLFGCIHWIVCFEDLLHARVEVMNSFSACKYNIAHAIAKVVLL